MWEQLRVQWRFLAAAVVLIVIAVGALAASVAVLAQGQGDDDVSQQVVEATSAPWDAALATAEASATVTSSSAQPAGQPTPRPPQGVTYHTVQSGETLGKIAAAYGLSSAAVADANGLSNPNMIRVGQKLIIPAR